MKASKQFMQIVYLMLIAAALVLLIMYSSTVLKWVLVCVEVITPFIVGGAIAFILNIPMSAIEKRWLYKLDGTKAAKFKRAISIVCTLIFIAGLIVLLLVIVIPNMSKTFAEIAKQVPTFLENLSTWLAALNVPGVDGNSNILDAISQNIDQITKKLAEFVQNGAGDIINSTVSILTSVIGVVVSGIIAFVFALYTLAQKERITSQMQKLLQAYVSEKYRRRIYKVARLLRKNFTSFITGQCLDATILGTMFVIVLAIFRVPYALMIGVLIAFTALIPVVGASLGCAVGCLLILMSSPIKIIRFLIIFIVLQQLEGKLIYPKIVGSSVGLPALWVLVAIAVGGSLFGVVGMLVFIPIVSTLYTLLREDVYRRIGEKEEAN